MANPGRPRKHDPRADEIRQEIKYGDLNKVRELIKDAGIEVADGENRTTLFHAVCANAIDLVAWLLNISANPNHLDRKGYSPLYAAVNNSNVEIVRILLDGGSDPNLCDSWGNGALWYATHNACLLNATNKQFIILRLLLDGGANPHQTNFSGVSPFQRAQRCERVLQVFISVDAHENGYGRKSELFTDSDE